MKKARGLGRGLEALLGGETPAFASADASTPSTLPVARLVAGQFQPRTKFDEAALSALADSIKSQGLMQPIVVRKLAAEKFEIIAGERRFRAAQRAGLADVPVVVREVDDKDALALALIENIQREDLNVIEEARALKRLAEEFSLTHEQVAQAVGRSRSAVSNLLRLTELHEKVQTKVLDGVLEMGHARALAVLPMAEQLMLAEKIGAQKLTVRDAEKLAAQQSAPKAPSAQISTRKDPDLARLEEELAEALGAYVSVKPGKNGAGEVLVRYASLEQLDGILERVRR